MANAEQLSIYVAEGSRAQGKLLYQALIEAARTSGLVGMTVMRTAVGYVWPAPPPPQCGLDGGAGSADDCGADDD